MTTARLADIEVITRMTVPGVVLELTEREAETLAIVCRLIGGDPERTRRGDTDNILAALQDVGHGGPPGFVLDRMDGHPRFVEEA